MSALKTAATATESPEKLTVADAVAEELQSAGVDRVFGLPGGEVLWLMEALRKRDIGFVLCRHEADAGIAAAVYGKLKGVPGVVLTTLGPGAANLMLPLASSLLEREALLAISAQLPVGTPAISTHQKVPFEDCYGPLAKYTGAIEEETCRETIRNAIAACVSEPNGPAFLTLSATEARERIRTTAKIQTPREDASLLTHADTGSAARQIYDAISAAADPLVIVGLGTRTATSTALRMWLKAWNLPVGVTPKVKGIVDETAPNFVGVFGGMAVDTLMLEAVASADLIVGFGLDPVEIDKDWHTSANILWVLESPGATGVVPDKGLAAGSHAEVLAELLSLTKPQRDVALSPALEAIRHRRLALVRTDVQLQGSIHPLKVVTTLAERAPADSIVTTDVGSHKYLFGQFWPSTNPQTFFMSNGLSGMGYGLPAALGAKLARPKQTVICILGDGGFAMTSQELETAVRLDAPLIVVVLIDNSYSLIKLGQESRQLPTFGVDFNPIDCVATARACGAEAYRAETAPELAIAFETALADSDSKTTLIEAVIDYASYREII